MDVECGNLYKALSDAVADGSIRKAQLDVSLRRLFRGVVVCVCVCGVMKCCCDAMPGFYHSPSFTLLLLSLSFPCSPLTHPPFPPLSPLSFTLATPPVLPSLSFFCMDHGMGWDGIGCDGCAEGACGWGCSTRTKPRCRGLRCPTPSSRTTFTWVCVYVYVCVCVCVHCMCVLYVCCIPFLLV
jgi:hypothetical protein